MRATSAKSRAIQAIREWIEKGVMGAGEVIPAERQLADDLKVSRVTVRAALIELERTGVLTRKKNCRPAVAERSTAQGVMADTVAVISLLANDPHPVFSGSVKAIDDGAMQAIRSRGLHALMIHPDLMTAEGILKLARGCPRGILIMDQLAVKGEGAALARRFKQMGIPVVVNADGEGLADIDRVISDHVAGTRRLVGWLRERGCKRILRVWMMADEKPYWLDNRNAGYEAAVTELGLPCLPPLHVPDFSWPGTDDRTRFENLVRYCAGYLIESFRGEGRPDALLLLSDGQVPEVTAACRLFGLEPNRDIHIAGYDNLWRDAPDRKFEPTPPAVTIDKFNQQIGSGMVDLLMDRLAGVLPQSAQRRVVESRLVVL